jgi:hypothetical protein
MVSSTRDEMDSAVQTLQDHKDTWATLSVHERIALLNRLIRDFAALGPRWVTASCQAKGIAEDAPLVAEEWGAGTLPVMHTLRKLRQSLSDIESDGHPHIPGPVTTRPNGQIVAQVFPRGLSERLFFPGVTAEVWMDPRMTVADLSRTPALVYHVRQPSGKIALVLGAGNVASIGPMDTLYKLFVENQVVLFKANPVNAYLDPLLQEGFRVLVEAGFLRIAYGGIEEGNYLCNHPDIDDIHLTGSDKTYEAIVFGSGSEGAARKATGRPLLLKRVTGELGNVSPVIIVPGLWKRRDLVYQAQHIVTSLVTNAGFNCHATQVIIQHTAWQQRKDLLQEMRRVLSQIPPRVPYYPGAQDRHAAFLTAHPDSELFGITTPGCLPWTLIAGLDPNHKDDICFTTEAFCGLFAETGLEAEGVVEYLARAVTFANEHLWGTLSATLIIHPESFKEPAIARAWDTVPLAALVGLMLLLFMGLSFLQNPTRFLLLGLSLLVCSPATTIPQ